jgi:hypothetical protein
MNYKVIPFVAKITREDSSAAVAQQMQSLIDANTSEGWEYLRMDSVQTNIAGTNGCFGLGAEPARATSFSVLVFQKAV